MKPLCFGTVFVLDTATCWFKNDTFIFQQSAVQQTTNSHLAIPQKSEPQPLDTDCPFRNGSTETSSKNENFTIHCNQDILGADYNPRNAPIAGAPFHATSLSDCMNQCSTAETLCTAVAYNPGLGEGFANCYPKFFTGTPSFIKKGSANDTADILHSAVAKLPNIPFQCENGQTATSSNGTSFTLKCNQDQPNNDLAQFHTTDLQSCLSSCEDFTDGNCIAVIFDTSMASGFQNCYLKNGVGAPDTNKNGYIFAKRGDISSGSGSKAWIAGPVVGGIAGIALIGAGWWFYKRRQRQARDKAATEAQAEKNKGLQYNGTYNQVDYKYQQQQGNYRWPLQADEASTWPQQMPITELDAPDVSHELPTAQSESVEMPVMMERAELPTQMSPVHSSPMQSSPMQTTPVQSSPAR